jgi:outer membrane protein OmpA-like peptidoglycan-associated protein
MADSLLDIFSTFFTNDVVQQTSAFLDESPAHTEKAVQAAVPALLAALSARASTVRGAESVMSLIDQVGSKLDVPALLGDASPPYADLATLGRTLLAALFGCDAESMSDALATAAGVRPASASTLLGVMMPIVLGVLGRETTTRNLNPGGLASLLASERDEISHFVPPSLNAAISTLRSPSLQTLPLPPQPTPTTPPPPPTAPSAPTAAQRAQQPPPPQQDPLRAQPAASESTQRRAEVSSPSPERTQATAPPPTRPQQPMPPGPATPRAQQPAASESPKLGAQATSTSAQRPQTAQAPPTSPTPRAQEPAPSRKGRRGRQQPAGSWQAVQPSAQQTAPRAQQSAADSRQPRAEAAPASAQATQAAAQQPRAPEPRPSQQVSQRPPRSTSQPAPQSAASRDEQPSAQARRRPSWLVPAIVIALLALIAWYFLRPHGLEERRAAAFDPPPPASAPAPSAPAPGSPAGATTPTAPATPPPSTPAAGSATAPAATAPAASTPAASTPAASPSAAVRHHLRLEAGSASETLDNFLASGANDVPKTFTFDRIVFQSASTTLMNRSRRTVAELTEILKAYPNAQVQLAAHTDNMGDADKNKALSLKRAEAIKKMLVSGGINESRLTTEGFGQEKPIASNNSVEGRRRNRRLELVVVKR